MKVIFLDIDGVLVNRKSWYVRSGLQATADPPCVAALNRIVAETGACVVISSTWRHSFRLRAELQELLDRWGVVVRVIGRTPDMRSVPRASGVVLAAQRGDEIQAWLDQQAGREPVESFVILDDESDMGRLLPRLVKTEFETGLTEADADAAIAALSATTPATEAGRAQAALPEGGR